MKNKKIRYQYFDVVCPRASLVTIHVHKRKSVLNYSLKYLLSLLLLIFASET